MEKQIKTLDIINTPPTKFILISQNIMILLQCSRPLFIGYLRHFSKIVHLPVWKEPTFTLTILYSKLLYVLRGKNTTLTTIFSHSPDSDHASQPLILQLSNQLTLIQSTDSSFLKYRFLVVCSFSLSLSLSLYVCLIISWCPAEPVVFSMNKLPHNILLQRHVQMSLPKTLPSRYVLSFVQKQKPMLSLGAGQALTQGVPLGPFTKGWCEKVGVDRSIDLFLTGL